jgi:hypothetical protein
MSRSTGCNSVWREDVKRPIDLKREKATLKRFLTDAALDKVACEKIANGTSRRRNAGGQPFGAYSPRWVGEQLACHVIGHCRATQRRELSRPPRMIRMRRCGPDCAAEG